MDLTFISGKTFSLKAQDQEKVDIFVYHLAGQWIGMNGYAWKK